MKTIGIVGGMSPESSVTYYLEIVHHHQKIRGNHDYPRIILASVSFGQYIEWQHAGSWTAIADALQVEFEALARAGADFAILATNTMHKVLPEIRSALPVLHVVDAVFQHARDAGIRTVALTGTRFTMSDGFYEQELEKRGLSAVIPSTQEQDLIHGMIYDELIAGRVVASSVKRFREIVTALASRGAEAVLLGCTELELLTRESPLPVPILDSATLHARAAWGEAVGAEP